MEINSAAEVLVVILSIFLAIFLLLGIVLAGYLVAISRQIRRITTAAEKTVGSLESVIAGFAKVVSPAVIAAAVKRYINKIKKAKGE